MLVATMNPSAQRLSRYVKAARAGAGRRIDDWRNVRKSATFEYFAIHDGRTLNACSGLAALHLHCDGVDSTVLPATSVEGGQHRWVVDLLGLGLPPGAYRLAGVDAAGRQHAVTLRRGTRPRKGGSTFDGKVDDLDTGAVKVVVVGGSVGIEVSAGDGRPRVASVNYHGPSSLMLELVRTSTNQRIIGTDRDSGDIVDIGQLVNGVGEFHVRRLYCQDSGAELRWDISLHDESGQAHAVHGPVVDYTRPDQATSFGDVSVMADGRRDRWKPYITRDGRLAVRVTAEGGTN